VALIAVVGLTVTVVILASDSNEAANTTPPGLGGIRYGGFNPATGQPESAPLPSSPRGPDEGTPGSVSSTNRPQASRKRKGPAA
jgi:hypothetical protein